MIANRCHFEMAVTYCKLFYSSAQAFLNRRHDLCFFGGEEGVEKNKALNTVFTGSIGIQFVLSTNI